MTEHPGIDPDPSLPIPNSASNSCYSPAEAQEGDPDHKMGDSQNIIRRPDSRAYLQGQERVSLATTKRPSLFRESFNKVTSKIMPNIKTLSHPYTFSPHRPTPSLQKENNSKASVALSYSQRYDTRQSEPCTHCPRHIDEYEAKISVIRDSHKQELQTVIQECQKQEKRIERLKSAKGRVETLESEVAERNSYINILKEQIATQDIRNSDLKSELSIRSTQIDNLETEIVDRDIKIETQSQTINQERNERKRRIERLNSELAAREAQVRALKSTISKNHAGNPDSVPDNKITSEYQYLISQLKNWTLSNFRKSIPTNIQQTITDFGLNPDTDAQTISTVNKYLGGNISQKCLAIDMLVMRYLCKHIFSLFVFGLDEKEEEFFHNLKSSFTKSTEKEINFWRSTTIQMVIATESHKRKVDHRKEEIVSSLESILMYTPPSSAPMDTNNRVENLKIIVTQAVEFSFILRAQRPNYFMFSPLSGDTFRGDIMESAEDNLDDDSDTGSGTEDESPPGSYPSRRERSVGSVGLSIFPSLLKRGNDDGEKYEEEICIYKGKVVKA